MLSGHSSTNEAYVERVYTFSVSSSVNDPTMQCRDYMYATHRIYPLLRSFKSWCEQMRYFCFRTVSDNFDTVWVKTVLLNVFTNCISMNSNICIGLLYYMYLIY